MARWQIYALLSAVFAGCTSVLAKAGLREVTADFGLAVRTLAVCVLVLAVALSGGDLPNQWRALSMRSLGLLVLSAITTTCSWVLYYRAMKEGTVTFVSLIDKGSILVTLALSIALLGESFSLRTAIGAGLIAGGVLVLSWK